MSKEYECFKCGRSIVLIGYYAKLMKFHKMSKKSALCDECSITLKANALKETAPKPQANTHKNLKYEILAALECDKDCGDKVDTDTCFDNQVERVETLLQEARANERQAMLDALPKVNRIGYSGTCKTCEKPCDLDTCVCDGRNETILEIRSAIKLMGGE